MYLKHNSVQGLVRILELQIGINIIELSDTGNYVNQICWCSGKQRFTATNTVPSEENPSSEWQESFVIDCFTHPCLPCSGALILKMTEGWFPVPSLKPEEEEQTICKSLFVISNLWGGGIRRTDSRCSSLFCITWKSGKKEQALLVKAAR